jgi:hypothetical protein
MVELGVVALGAYLLVEIVMRGALTRTLFGIATTAFALLDAFGMRVVRLVRPPRFAVLGRCRRCGECCRMIIGDPPGFVKKSVLLDLYVAYHRVAHAFILAGRGPNGEVLLACARQRADGRCGIYARRPLLCRNYPVLPFFDEPKLLPSCGFRIAQRAVARMRPRAALRILNPGVTVRHPTREHAGELSRDDDFEWVDDTPGPT